MHGHGHLEDAPEDHPEDAGHPAGESDTTGAGSSGRDYARTPLILTWEVTQACGLSCDHCRAEATTGRHPDELSTAEAKRFVDDVAEFGHPPPVLVLSGGDPLRRPDLFELVEYATAQGLPTCVTPAPTGQLDAGAVRRLAEAGVKRVALSLDRATAPGHDEFRGEAGSYDAFREAVALADAADLPFQVNTTVTAGTVGDLPAVADQVERLGASMWEVFFLVPVGRGETLEQLRPADSVEWLAWLYRRSRSGVHTITVEAPHYRPVARQVDPEATVGSTRAGHGFLFVSHTGEIYPSGFMPESVGNVRTHDVVERYRTADLLGRLRDPDRFGDPCGSCPYRVLCGGSRSRAAAVTGDPLAADPLCPGPEVIETRAGGAVPPHADD